MPTAFHRFTRAVMIMAGLLTAIFMPRPGFSQTFRIIVAPGLQNNAADGASDGRLLLLMATNDKTEPRFQVNDGAGTQLVFGIDVDGWKGGEARLMGVDAFGYPLQRLKDVP